MSEARLRHELMYRVCVIHALPRLVIVLTGLNLATGSQAREMCPLYCTHTRTCRHSSTNSAAAAGSPGYLTLVPCYHDLQGSSGSRAGRLWIDLEGQNLCHLEGQTLCHFEGQSLCHLEGQSL